MTSKPNFECHIEPWQMYHSFLEKQWREIFSLLLNCSLINLMLRAAASRTATEPTDQLAGVKQMKKFLMGSVTAISMAICSYSSHAADVMDAPTSYNWSGPYIGVHVGGGWLDATDVTYGGGTVDASGIIGGVIAGYNVQAGEFLVGVESDVSFGDFDGDNVASGGYISKFSPNAVGTIRGRIGLTFDRVLMFATGGLMIANMEAEHIDFGGGADGEDETHFSFVLGGGVEWAVADSIRVRGEYLYSDLKSETYGFFGGTDQHVLSIDNLHIARAVVIWNF